MSFGGIAGESLLQGVTRIERLEEEKRGIGADIKDVYAQLKSQGFDVKTIRKLVVLRRQSPEQREEEQTLLDLYMAAIGMLDAPPSRAPARKAPPEADAPETQREDRDTRHRLKDLPWPPTLPTKH